MDSAGRTTTLVSLILHDTSVKNDATPMVISFPSARRRALLPSGGLEAFRKGEPAPQNRAGARRKKKLHRGDPFAKKAFEGWVVLAILKVGHNY